MALLGAVRSLLSLLLVGLWFLFPGSPWLRLYILPMAWLHPERRTALVSSYMKAISGGILALLRVVGGARFKRTGQLPTERPILILMNHQSLLDICTVTLMSSAEVPAFVTRRRYARFVPLVSASIRLLGCPLVDPRRDPRGALKAVEASARTQARSFLIFPEGHRSKDGQIHAFKPGGTLATLRGRRMPVYLVVTDGFWEGRRLVDSLFSIHRIRGETEVLGPFHPPSADTEVPAFVERMRGLLVAHLLAMRQRHAAG